LVMVYRRGSGYVRLWIVSAVHKLPNVHYIPAHGHAWRLKVVEMLLEKEARVVLVRVMAM
jgi:hypothetical protein